jgi:hypothetical protein
MLNENTMEEEIITLEHNDTARNDVQQRDMSRHTLTIRQAADLFASLGVPRSPRSIQRFCELNSIDSIRVKGEKTERYFVSKDSVERYAKELKQLENISHIESDTARHDASQHDTTRHDSLPSLPEQKEKVEQLPDREAEEFQERIITLEKEKMQLAIDRAAKEQVINQMLDERREWMRQLTQQSREIGQLEMQVLQIDAPRDIMSRHDETEAAERIAADKTIAPSQLQTVETVTKTPPLIPTEESRRSLWGKLFG